MQLLLQDLRYALRMLAKNFGLTAVPRNIKKKLGWQTTNNDGLPHRLVSW